MNPEDFKTFFEANEVAEEYRSKAMNSLSGKFDKHLDFVEISDDGATIVGASNLNGRIWSGSLWMYRSPSDAPNIDKSLTGIEFESGVTDGKFLDRGSRIVVCEDTGSIQFLDLVEPADKKTYYFTTGGIVTEHEDIVTALAVPADKLKLVSCSADMSIKLWDISSFFCEKSYKPAHAHMVTNVSMEPESNHVFVSTSLDGSSKLWDVRLDRPASAILTNNDGFTSSSWISGNHVALGSSDGQVLTLDIRKPAEVESKVQSYNRPVHRLKCDKNMNYLAVCGDETNVIVYNCSDNTLVKMYEDDKHNDFIRGLAWSSSSLYTCAWDEKILQHSMSDVSSGVS